MSNKKQKEIITLDITENDVMEMEEWIKAQEANWVRGQMSMELGTRTYQQDAAYLSVDPELKQAFAIICDGMGGLQAGEQASNIAVTTMVQDYDMMRTQLDNYYYFFQKEAEKADRLVAALTDGAGNSLDAGTTLVAVALQEDRLQWISVGDSRLFIIRGNDIVSVTKEHNYLTLLNEQLLSGNISMEEYEQESFRGAALTSYIGMGNVQQMELNYDPLLLLEGDIILLCSDGLTKALTDSEIWSIVYQNKGNLREALEQLQQAVCVACPNIRDNTSIVMLQYHNI